MGLIYLSAEHKMEQDRYIPSLGVVPVTSQAARGGSVVIPRVRRRLHSTYPTPFPDYTAPQVGESLSATYSIP